MALYVQKFGGTSVGSVERIKAVAEKVKRDRDAGHQVVVVVSAMSGETNRLIELASQINEDPTPREMDMLVSTGTFTHGHVGAGCLPELLALLVPGGRLICTVHRDVWDEGGFGTGLQALTQARVAVVRSREAERLFTDDDEPSGWYTVVEKLFY